MRDYLQEAMDAMMDLSLSDIEAVRKAAKLMEQSRATDISKAFTMGFSMDLRAIKKRDAAKATASDERRERAGEGR